MYVCVYIFLYIHIYIYIHIHIYTMISIYCAIVLLGVIRGQEGPPLSRRQLRLRGVFRSTASFHNIKSQNFKFSVSNPKSEHVAYLSVLSQI